MVILGYNSLAMTGRYMHVLEGLKRESAGHVDRQLTGTEG